MHLVTPLSSASHPLALWLSCEGAHSAVQGDGRPPIPSVQQKDATLLQHSDLNPADALPVQEMPAGKLASREQAANYRCVPHEAGSQVPPFWGTLARRRPLAARTRG